MTDEYDPKKLKAAHKFRAAIKGEWMAERAKATGIVRFTQGDWDVLMKHLPGFLAAMMTELLDGRETIEALEKRIAALEARNERHAEIIREAAARGRAKKEILEEGCAPPEGPEAAGETRRPPMPPH